MKRRRILVLTHEDLVPADTLEGVPEGETPPWKTDYDVVTTLRYHGHEVRVCGVVSDLRRIRNAIDEFKPHLAFNLLEEFHGESLYDQHIASYLELLRMPYTGCNPRGLTLAHDKALSKQILAYHRIPVPKFAVFPMGRKARRPAKLGFPLLVKSLVEHASLGIAQSSIVTSDDKLAERVTFIHENLETDAIAEQYIDGRELYVAIVGNRQLQTFPIFELFFRNLPEGAPRIATAKVKWDEVYQAKIGLASGPAQDLPEPLVKKVTHMCKRVYRTLFMSGYGRVDLRLDDAGNVFVLEANPNPDLGYGQEFAESADKAGIKYEALIQRIVNLGLRYAKSRG